MGYSRRRSRGQTIPWAVSHEATRTVSPRVIQAGHAVRIQAESSWFDLARKMHLPGPWLAYVVTMSETDHAVVITIRKDKTNSTS